MLDQVSWNLNHTSSNWNSKGWVALDGLEEYSAESYNVNSIIWWWMIMLLKWIVF